MFSFAQKMVILFQNSVFGEIQFSQKSLISSGATNPYNILLLLQAPAQRCRKKAKILEKGARGDKGSPEQNESPIPDLSNAL